jgi:hypothetical protein
MNEGVPGFWRWVFRVKAVWNCSGSVGFLLGDDQLRDWLHTPHPDPVYRALFLALAFVFGLGYWWVADDPDRNRNIIWMGVLGQLSVFLILAWAVALAPQPLPWPFLGPGVIDLTFAIAFMVYLGKYPQRTGDIHNPARGVDRA